MSCPEVLLLNGPNLDRLGTREPAIYGTETLADIEAMVCVAGERLGVEVRCVQSNSEGALVDAVYAAADSGAIGAVVNAGAYTHTSIALRDALVGAQLPFVEVHISNVHAREAFRHESLLSDVAVGGVFGLGTHGYILALEGLMSGAGGAAARSS